LADAALENRAEASGANRCGTFLVQEIALGWTLSRESRNLMSCLARTNKGIQNIATQLVEPQTAAAWITREHLQAFGQ
jgi:hypothetical protein